ncbi:MAG TPA: putative oxidoreductase C-terminal domain-containing protein, partial [Cyclobacteriaceae bacterium]|nr:putative oxidoreductase C-terminal domain-containing protein [Cyclobacteriaceae bacterium]
YIGIPQRKDSKTTMKQTQCYHGLSARPMLSALPVANNFLTHILQAAIVACSFFMLISCKPTTSDSEQSGTVKLLTLDPGHFHAALVQKEMFPNVDSTVHVYAPAGPDVEMHLKRIDGFNGRKENPTGWVEEVYTGDDFFEKMISEKDGNVVVISGNNKKKAEYILKSLQADINVLADKPMAINNDGFAMLKDAFEVAKKKDLLLYDIMTERYEITTILQKELSMMPEIFGTLEKGTPENPAVTKESVHHFYKYVSGSILARPPWFMDVSQQGEGIVDVTTHLVDLVQWECFPDQVIDYTKDIQIGSAKRSATDMTLSQFKAITRLNEFPDYLQKDVVNDSVLRVYGNGEINYTLKGAHAKVSVIWNYKAPEGAGDTHYSIMRGTKSNLVIQQGPEQNYVTALYIQPVGNDPGFEKTLLEEFKKLESKYPGISLQAARQGWEVIVPQQYRESHEAHFSRVAAKFLEYLKNRNMPEWEVPNMIAKYYTTTKALEVALK